MKTVYFLIGLPGIGKSTWIRNKRLDADTSKVISSDDHIEAEAQRQKRTYNDVFRSYIKTATREMYQDLEKAFKNEVEFIFWDQTNLTRKARASKIKMVPDDYKKVAVYFKPVEPTEWARRLLSRPEKTIPTDKLVNMARTMESPSLDEGFDEIIKI